MTQTSEKANSAGINSSVLEEFFADLTGEQAPETTESPASEQEEEKNDDPLLNESQVEKPGEAEKKEEEKKPEAKEGEKKEGDAAEKPVDDTSKEGEEKDEDKDPEMEFDLPGEKTGEEKSEGDGWIELAKTKGIEIKEDTYEAYEAAIDKHYEEKYKPQFEKELAKHPPEAQMFFEFLKAGGSMNDFAEPLKPYQDLRALPDAELIEVDLKARKWPEDKIQKEITRLVEADQIDLEAQKLREKIDVLETGRKNEIINQKIEAEKRFKEREANAVIEEGKTIKQHLNTVSEFMETKLSDKHKDYLMKNWESGKYHELMKDPKAIVDFMTFVEFGQKGISNLRNKAFHEGKMKYKNDRHNIPPITGGGEGGGKRSATNTKPKAGNWEALDDFAG